MLALDASTGQNALSQAKEFSKITPLTGLILTKIDGTAKGGVVLAIRQELDIPVKFIGFGEKSMILVNLIQKISCVAFWKEFYKKKNFHLESSFILKKTR